jgi:hypothetical protein
MSEHLTLSELLAYRTGELAASDEDRVESHFFECARCTASLESIEWIRAGVVDAVRGGFVTGTVTAEFLDHAAREGARIRTYALAPGETVFCTIAPEDDFVAIRMRGQFEGMERVDLAMRTHRLATGETDLHVSESVTPDLSAGELIVLYSGHLVRSLPRSRFDMEVRAPDERVVFAYVLEHSPWEEHEPA